MKIKKHLKPIAISLPTLLAAYSYGFTTLTLDQNTSPDWTASGNLSTGYTSATYSGSAITLHRINQGLDPTVSPDPWVTTLNDTVNNATSVTISASWSANTYTQAESNLNSYGNNDRYNTAYTTLGYCANGNCNDASAWLH
jgi:hypothetical protein